MRSPGIKVTVVSRLGVAVGAAARVGSVSVRALPGNAMLAFHTAQHIRLWFLGGRTTFFTGKSSDVLDDPETRCAAFWTEGKKLLDQVLGREADVF